MMLGDIWHACNAWAGTGARYAQQVPASSLPLHGISSTGCACIQHTCLYFAFFAVPGACCSHRCPSHLFCKPRRDANSSQSCQTTRRSASSCSKPPASLQPVRMALAGGQGKKVAANVTLLCNEDIKAGRIRIGSNVLGSAVQMLWVQTKLHDKACCQGGQGSEACQFF